MYICRCAIGLVRIHVFLFEEPAMVELEFRMFVQPDNCKYIIHLFPCAWETRGNVFDLHFKSL